MSVSEIKEFSQIKSNQGSNEATSLFSKIQEIEQQTRSQTDHIISQIVLSRKILTESKDSDVQVETALKIYENYLKLESFKSVNNQYSQTAYQAYFEALTTLYIAESKTNSTAEWVKEKAEKAYAAISSMVIGYEAAHSMYVRFLATSSQTDKAFELAMRLEFYQIPISLGLYELIFLNAPFTVLDKNDKDAHLFWQKTVGPLINVLKVTSEKEGALLQYKVGTTLSSLLQKPLQPEQLDELYGVIEHFRIKLWSSDTIERILKNHLESGHVFYAIRCLNNIEENIDQSYPMQFRDVVHTYLTTNDDEWRKIRTVMSEILGSKIGLSSLSRELCFEVLSEASRDCIKNIEICSNKIEECTKQFQDKLKNEIQRSEKKLREISENLKRRNTTVKTSENMIKETRELLKKTEEDLVELKISWDDLLIQKRDIRIVEIDYRIVQEHQKVLLSKLSTAETEFNSAQVKIDLDKQKEIIVREDINSAKLELKSGPVSDEFKELQSKKVQIEKTVSEIHGFFEFLV